VVCAACPFRLTLPLCSRHRMTRLSRCGALLDRNSSSPLAATAIGCVRRGLVLGAIWSSRAATTRRFAYGIPISARVSAHSTITPGTCAREYVGCHHRHCIPHRPCPALLVLPFSFHVSIATWRVSSIFSALVKVRLTTCGRRCTIPCLPTSLPNSPVNDVTFHPDGLCVAACSSDHTIKIWDIRMNQLLQHYAAHQDAVNSISIHPSGDYMVSASSDMTTKVRLLSIPANVANLWAPPSAIVLPQDCFVCYARLGSVATSDTRAPRVRCYG